MKKLLILISFFGILVGSNLTLKAQGSKKPNKPYDLLLRKIVAVLNKDEQTNSLGQEISIFSSILVLQIDRAKRQKKPGVHIKIDDQRFYRLFPNYQALKDLDYTDLMTGKNRLTILLPILIFNKVDTVNALEPKHKFVPIDEVEKKMIALFKIPEQDNSTVYGNLVMLEPYIVEMMSVPKH